MEWIIDTQLIAPAEPLIQNGMVNEALGTFVFPHEKEKEFYRRRAVWRDKIRLRALHNPVL